MAMTAVPVYNLTYAGVPLLEDQGRLVRLPHRSPDGFSPAAQEPPRKHQPDSDLLEEVDRLLAWEFTRDYELPPDYPGRNLGALALPPRSGPQPSPWPAKVNTWYYPTGACRWSVFRGLATSSQVKAILAATGGSAAAPFVMQADPGLGNGLNYLLTTNLFMLPPRPLAEHGGGFDGLFLLTLVDERYWWQYASVSLRPNVNTQWGDLITQVLAALGQPAFAGAVPAAYGQPEPDSQLWAPAESAAVLLDALAANVGCAVVRQLSGAYQFYSPAQSAAVVALNRPAPNAVVRAAGGELFPGPATTLPSGDLTLSRNSALPASVTVCFPKYVSTDDPVPHFYNPRTANPRPPAWYEDSYGDTYSITVPITGGGAAVAGLTGVAGWTLTLHDTCKAYFATEADAGSGTSVLNLTGLTTLATQMAQDYYADRMGGPGGAVLDEVYPGTLAWAPEGFHDLVWTYSPRKRVASTRVLKRAWNLYPASFQHSLPQDGNSSTAPPGVGGRSVAQTVRDSLPAPSPADTTALASALGATDTFALFNKIDYLPTQNRWEGQIDNEFILFEGTGGTAAAPQVVDIVARGIDGSLAAPHAQGALITVLPPDEVPGVNLVTYEKGQFIFPQECNGGGIQGVRIVPQTQTVQVLSTTTTAMNGVNHYPGQVLTYNPRQTGSALWASGETVWVVERNGVPLINGKRYDGQFVGFSAYGPPAAPVYLVNETPFQTTGSGTGGGGGGGNFTVPCCPNNPLPGTLHLSSTSSCPVLVTNGLALAHRAGVINFLTPQGGQVSSPPDTWVAITQDTSITGPDGVTQFASQNWFGWCFYCETISKRFFLNYVRLYGQLQVIPRPNDPWSVLMTIIAQGSSSHPTCSPAFSAGGILSWVDTGSPGLLPSESCPDNSTASFNVTR
jgi:hypothetical protein